MRPVHRFGPSSVVEPPARQWDVSACKRARHLSRVVASRMLADILRSWCDYRGIGVQSSSSHWKFRKGRSWAAWTPSSGLMVVITDVRAKPRSAFKVHDVYQAIHALSLSGFGVPKAEQEVISCS